jgi:hypothetical protein
MADITPQGSVQDRAAAWVSAWHTIERSTEPVDRDRAERAMAELYAERGLSRPTFIWVDHPADGVLAWHVAARAQDPLRNDFTRGDPGNGDNRALYQLHDPFGLEPDWSRRATARVQRWGGDALDDGFDGRGGYLVGEATIAHAVDGQLMRDSRASRSGWDRAHVDWDEADPPVKQVQRVATTTLARRVIGDRWNELEALFGTDALIDLALDALVGTANHILDVRPSLNQALHALTFPAFDRASIVMGSLHHVLGLRVWRQQDEFAERTAMMERRLELARSGVAFWALDGLAILMERPSRIGLDQRGRLHSAGRPALAWGTHLQVWADHGVIVPRHVIEEPQTLTVAEIDAEQNAEVRRVMIERFGAERLVQEGNAKLLAEDEAGRLWRRPLRGARWGEEAVVMVEVRNATPEPDGTVRTYWLRVPPHVRSARAAVAWTFGLDSERYEPALQT